MKKNYIISIIILMIILFSQDNFCQNFIKLDRLKSNFAKDENKEKYYSNLVKNVTQTFSGKINKNYSTWIKALRDAQSINLQNESVDAGLSKALKLPIDKNVKLQRVALEVASNYSHNISNEFQRIFDSTKDKISFSIAACYLAKKNKNLTALLGKLKTKFPKFENNSILSELFFYLTNIDKPNFPKTSEIKDILSHDFQNGKTIVYSFHRKNRNYPGITIIKKPNGEFVRNKDGSMFHIPQLALSYSNLPGFIPNGNTPEGIYSIIGWYISPTETIGPTPNILVRSPFEVSPSIFYHNQNKSRKWNLDDYKSILPNSWINKHSIYQSYNAGKSGRRLIIMHGSTDELNYYENKLFYPLTPTRGCLSAKEIWNGKNGKCENSDQLKLINAYKSVKQKKGFLVVVELDDKNKSISINEIMAYIK